VRLGKSASYRFPNASVIHDKGLILQSEIRISPLPRITPEGTPPTLGIRPVPYFLNTDFSALLEEPTHAIGRISDIDHSGLADYICDRTMTLNRFGKALIRINYFLNPNTTLFQPSSSAFRS
jgi:hypothetical protein